MPERNVRESSIAKMQMFCTQRKQFRSSLDELKKFLIAELMEDDAKARAMGDYGK